MLKRNNVWEYGEGLLQACISSIDTKCFLIAMKESERIAKQRQIITKLFDICMLKCRKIIVKCLT